MAQLIAKRRPKSALPPRVTPGVPTEIRIHDDSTQATIVEVFTRDRVGVLYAITQTLAKTSEPRSRKRSICPMLRS